MRFQKACLAVAFVAACRYSAAAPAGDCSGGEKKEGGKPSSVECSVSVPAVHYGGPDIESCGFAKLSEGVPISLDGVSSVNAVAVVSLVSNIATKTVYVPHGVCTEADGVDLTHVIVAATVPAVVKTTIYASMDDCGHKSGGTTVGDDSEVAVSTEVSVGTSVGTFYKPGKTFSVGAVYVEVAASSGSGLTVPGVDVKTTSEIDINSDTVVDNSVSVVSNVDV